MALNVVGIKFFKKYNSLEFGLKDAKEPFLTENNIMWGYSEPELTKRIKELEIDESFSAKVRSILFELIPAGQDCIESVAKFNV